MTNRKIYCCFQFLNEVELLKLKFEELYDVIDYFVISESVKSTSGVDKLLYFKENKHLFSKYSNKIIYQTVNNTPSSYQELLDMKPINNTHKKIIECVKNSYWFDKNVESYIRVTYEKEMLFLPLINCKDGDIIILGDLDEIPKASAIKEISDNFDDNQIYHLHHNNFYYFLNLRINESWVGNFVLSFKKFRENSFCELRQHKQGIFIEDGGWHFTYMGGLERLRYKVESMGEQSLNVDWVKDGLKNSVDNALNLNRDLFNRPRKFWIEELSYKTHPKYLVEHQDEFRDFIYKDV